MEGGGAVNPVVQTEKDCITLVTIRNNLNNQEQPGTTRNNQEPGTTRNNQKQTGTTRNNQEHPGTTRNNQEKETTGNNQEQPKIQKSLYLLRLLLKLKRTLKKYLLGLI